MQLEGVTKRTRTALENLLKWHTGKCAKVRHNAPQSWLGDDRSFYPHSRRMNVSTCNINWGGLPFGLVA
jgi:hypothetical protein